MQNVLSIIIPCYNLGSYIDACLKSISRQKSDLVEYIFIDDGSTDGTSTKLKVFCDNSQKYKYFYQNNKGVSEARNVALDYIKSEYFYLLDGDDELTDNSIEIILKNIKDHEADVILSPAIQKKGNVTKLSDLKFPLGFYSVIDLFKTIKIFPSGHKLVYKTEIIKNFDIRFRQNLKVGEVFEFTLHFLKHSKIIKVIPEPLFYYVIRENSATNTFKFSQNITILETLKYYLNDGKELEPYNSYWVTLFRLVNCFGYVKIIKGKIITSEEKKFIQILFKNKDFRLIIKKVITGFSTPLKERLFASYIWLFKSYGLKPLCLIFKLLNYRSEI